MSLFSEMNEGLKKMIVNAAMDEQSKITLLTLADDLQKEHDDSIADQHWLASAQLQKKYDMEKKLN